MENVPRVGIGVIVIKDEKVLCMKRINTHGNGTWGFLGGKLEFKESWEECAAREVMEEVNIRIKNIRFGTVLNIIFEEEKKHHVSIIMVAEYESGELKNLEPHKGEELQWSTWDAVPEPWFLPVLEMKKQGFNPFKI